MNAMRFKKFLFVFPGLLILPHLVFAGGDSAGPVTLAEHRRPGAVIIIGKSAGKVEYFAAEELQTYVSQIASAKIPILVAGDPLISRCSNEIVIGRPETNPLVAEFVARDGLQLGTNILGGDGYLLKSIKTGTNNILVLTGSNDRSPLFAVYHLLETCGVRFFGYKSREGEIVPHQDSLVVAPLDIVEKPHMKYRFVSDNGYDAANKAKLTDIADWGAKNRCNAFMITPSRAGETWGQIALEEVEKRGFMIAGPGHILARLTPDEQLFKTHPEYFPLVNGKRSSKFSPEWGGATAFCWSNPDAMQIVVNNAVKYYRENPFINLLAIYPPDGSQHGAMCQCENCSKMAVSDWYLTLLNRIDAALKPLPSHPKLMWISYNECSVPPAHIHPVDEGRDFVLVWCNELRDHHEPMDSEANRRATRVLEWKPRLKPIKTDFMKNPGDQDLAAWYRWQHWSNYLKSGNYHGDVSLLEYYNEHVAKSLSVPMLAYCQSGPWPDNLMQKDFQFYESQGITGWQNCTDYYNDKPNSYWNYLGARMMWNPQADVADINQDCYRQLYGPAANLMQTYFTALWNEIASPDMSLASRDRVVALGEDLQKAAAIAMQNHDPGLEQRLKDARVFQAHVVELKARISETYNPDGSPKLKPK